MLCQTCSAYNDDEREFCFRCQNKLLVLSGVNAFEEDELEDYEEEEDLSLDEHLLERVSALEEIVKRSAETIRSLVDAVQKHERAIFINQTGLLSVKEILEKKNVLTSDEVVELWESKMGEQMLALEKKQRFTERKDRMVSLFRGDKRERFLLLVADAEAAFDGFDPDRGMKHLEEAFRLDRDNYELSFFLGEMFFNDGNLDRAKAYLERTLEVQPDHFDAAVFYGVLLHEQQDLKGAVIAGFALTAMSVGWPLASTLSGRFLRTFDARGTVRIGGGLMFIGTLLLAAMPRSAGPAWIGLGSFVIGFGMGLLNTTFIILIQGSVAWEQRGSATAANIFARMLGSTLGAAILGAVLNAVLHQRLGASNGAGAGIDDIRRVFSGAAQAPGVQDTAALTAALSDGLARVFVVLALFGVLALVAAWRVPRRAIFAKADKPPLSS